MDSVQPMEVRGIKLDSFTVQYLATALWSTNDNSTEQGGEPFDANYSIEDFTNKALYQAIAECHRFKLVNDELLQKAYAEGIEASTAGHDFWLTRNHHGAGFWDGDYSKDLGEKLTIAAQNYGELGLYADENGMVEFE